MNPIREVLEDLWQEAQSWDAMNNYSLRPNRNNDPKGEAEKALNAYVEEQVRESNKRLEDRGMSWKLTFICCGREDGTKLFASWDEADTFRQSYILATYHDRQAILSRAL